MEELFDEIGFGMFDVIAICEYGDDIVAVKCHDCMSGIYPDYETAQPLVMGWLYNFRIHNKMEYGGNIDAIIFRKEKNNDKEYIEMFFAEDSHDGFQIISD